MPASAPRLAGSAAVWAAIVEAPPAPREERHPPEYRALLEKQNWKELTRRLVLWVHRRAFWATLADAEDIAQSTFVAVLEPTRKRWDPVAIPDFFFFLCGVATGEIANFRRSRKRKPARAYDHEGLEMLENIGAVATSVPSSEELYAARERANLIMQALEARIVDDAGCRSIVALLREGVEEREAQQRILKKDLAYVKNARRRLANHLAHVLAEIDGESYRWPALKENLHRMVSRCCGVSERMAATDLVEDIVAMKDADVAKALRDEGGDPDAIGARGEAFMRALLGKEASGETASPEWKTARRSRGGNVADAAAVNARRRSQVTCREKRSSRGSLARARTRGSAALSQLRSDRANPNRAAMPKARGASRGDRGARRDRGRRGRRVAESAGEEPSNEQSRQAGAGETETKEAALMARPPSLLRSPRRGRARGGRGPSRGARPA